MIFTKKQSKDFIKQLHEKKQIQNAIEALMKSITLQLHIPISFVNSGSKRVYETLFNSREFEKNYTITTSSIQASLGSINLKSQENTAPTQVALILNSGNIPHKFSTTAQQKTISCEIECEILSSNALEALQNVEYIVDNLSYQKTFRYKSMGIQFGATYGLQTTDLTTKTNKMFRYTNEPNTQSIFFTIEFDITYLAYGSANLIKYIYDNTIDPNLPTPTDRNPPLDWETGGSPEIEDGDGNIIAKYIGTVATAKLVDKDNELYGIDGGTWYHSEGLTEDQINEIVRVKVINDANKTKGL